MGWCSLGRCCSGEGWGIGAKQSGWGHQKMKPKSSFELFRWMYYVLLWLIIMGFGVTIVELAVDPALQWLLNDIPYQLPTWHRAGRMSLFVLFMGFFAGTVTWFYEKKTSGR